MFSVRRVVCVCVSANAHYCSEWGVQHVYNLSRATVHTFEVQTLLASCTPHFASFICMTAWIQKVYQIR